jgi:hypothetical protein
MPWRKDFVHSFWLDPDSVPLSGYPDERAEAKREPAEHPMGPVPSRVTPKYPTYTSKTGPVNPIGAAVIVLRDRTGFQYERQVGLGDFVSIREAAQLLRVPIMTLTRWVRSEKVKSSRRNGFVIIRVREVLRLAKERRTKLKLGIRLMIVG